MSNSEINETISAFVGTKRDYSSCLNAMHFAECILNDSQWCTYAKHLQTVRDAAIPEDSEHSRDYDYAHATDSQRAEAFLRCIGKWQAGKTRDVTA